MLRAQTIANWHHMVGSLGSGPRSSCRAPFPEGCRPRLRPLTATQANKVQAGEMLALRAALEASRQESARQLMKAKQEVEEAVQDKVESTRRGCK